jgi:hypothetical protein
MAELTELCHAQNINPKILDPSNRKYLTDKQIVDEFANTLNKPFHYYKESGNLDRTYERFNLKYKDTSEQQRKLNKKINEIKKPVEEPALKTIRTKKLRISKIE